MLIDFHTHCFPEKIAEKALSKLSFAAGGLEPHTEGTVLFLKEKMKEEGVTASVVLNIATNAHQMKSVNDFAAEINDGKSIFAFGSVYPDAPDALCELERIKDMGLLGVKLHPEYQGFFADDEKMKPIYKKISELSLITVFHSGADFGYFGEVKCTPKRLKRALSWFSSPVVAAHWGALSYWNEVIEELCGEENLYIDTAFGYSSLPREAAMKICEKHGTERILFATDSPWHTPRQEKRLIETLSLSEEEKERVYFKNAMRLLGLAH